MAYIDADSGRLVLRIVYDGAPLSGKTTTLRALGAIFRREVTSPGEAEGRTLWFDWMEYVGGTFEGAPISCQTLTVPGQAALMDRRRELLRDADAVVYVFDGAPDEFEAGAAALAQTRDVLRRATDGPEVGIVVQANKSDLPDAVEPARIKAVIRDAATAVVPASATERRGIREAFVLGVRLAIDRAHALAEAGALERRPLLEADAAALLDRLRRRERRSVADREPSAASPVSSGSTLPVVHEPQPERRWLPLALRQILPLIDPRAALGPFARRLRTHARPMHAATVAPRRPPPPTAASPREPQTAPREVPGFPGEDVPGGCIWPPVRGRIHLRDAVREGVASVDADPRAWKGVTGSGWHFHQPRELTFANATEARRALVAEARRRTEFQELLSASRCLVLSNEREADRWRLWEMIDTGPDARSMIQTALESGDEQVLARTLLRCARAWSDAWPTFEARERSRWLISLDLLGIDEDRVVYQGPFCDDDTAPAEHGERGEVPRDRLAAFRVAFADVLGGGRLARVSVPRLITAIEREAAAHPETLPLATPLVAMAIGH